MKNAAIRRDYYFVVKSEFIHDLELKGCDLSVFSVIYGLSQDKTMFCNMSLSTMAYMTGYSEKQVARSLERLKAVRYVESVYSNLYVNDALRQILRDHRFSLHTWCITIQDERAHSSTDIICIYDTYYSNYPFGQNVPLEDKMSEVYGQIVSESKEK